MSARRSQRKRIAPGRTRANDPEGLRRRVLDAAAELFQAQGYAATGVQDVFRAARVTAPTSSPTTWPAVRCASATPPRSPFPRLPVREGENVFVWIARYPSRRAYDDYLTKLASDARWSGEWFAALYKQLARQPELIMLEPTPRSRIGHAAR